MTSKLKMQRKTFVFDVFDVIAFLVFIVGIVLFVRFFVFNPFSVVGKSMHPTFEESDFILVDKISPRRGTLERGDVIVFVPPGKTIPYIKRIIGLPGEVVKIDDGKVFICDQKGEQCDILEEDYLPDSFTTKAQCGMTDFPVTDGFFVLGDHRGHSTDSLCCFGFGCYKDAVYEVPNDHIIGKVFLRLFPHFAFDFMEKDQD